MLERSEVTGMLPMWAWQDKQRFVEALDDDLNMPEALGALFEMVSRGNRSMDAGKLEPGDAWSVLAVLDELDQVLGYLAKPQAAGPGTEVETLLAQREAARKARNWAEGDRIRKRLAEMGWELRDTPEGPKVKRK
jgi:cysteinyl-tRNA synthetase